LYLLQNAEIGSGVCQLLMQWVVGFP